MPLPLPPSTQRGMAVPWCTTWPMPSGTSTASALCIETSSQRTSWYVSSTFSVPTHASIPLNDRNQMQTVTFLGSVPILQQGTKQV